MKLESGTRIRFKEELTAVATGDHPNFLFAKKGDLGVVVEAKSVFEYDYRVKSDRCPLTFLAKEDEIEPVKEKK